MLLDRLDENLDARDAHLPQPDGQRRALSVAMRPARRSAMLPSASRVQKLQRMATSPSWSSKPMPVASNAPRPITYFSGS
jgi:hypothetical protein